MPLLTELNHFRFGCYKYVAPNGAGIRYAEISDTNCTIFHKLNSCSFVKFASKTFVPLHHCV